LQLLLLLLPSLSLRVTTTQKAWVLYDETPEPIVDYSELTFVTIPNDFGEFVNNVESVGVVLKYDGDDSDIFTWASENYDINTDFDEPTGDVFAATVGFLDTVTAESGNTLCFHPTESDAAICSILFGAGDMFASISIDNSVFQEEDGFIDFYNLEEGASEPLFNTNASMSLGGAGIGVEFGNSYDSDSNTWTAWHWADGGDNDFLEGEYDVYLIQTIDTESTDPIQSSYLFSDSVEITFNGAITMASAAIAFTSVLYALI
jgi:hypothetical protein